VLWPSPTSTTNQAPHYRNSSWPRGSLARRATRESRRSAAGRFAPSVPPGGVRVLPGCVRPARSGSAPAPPPIGRSQQANPAPPGNPPPASRHRQLAMKWRLRVDSEPPPVYGESQDCCFLTTLMFWIHGLWLRALGLGFGLNDVVIWGFHYFCRSWGY